MSNKKKKQNDNSVNLNSTTTASNSTQTTPSFTKHDDKVNALAAVMSDLALTASSSLTNSDTQQPSFNFAASPSCNPWT